jgi:hypothetical protein
MRTLANALYKAGIITKEQADSVDREKTLEAKKIEASQKARKIPTAVQKPIEKAN